MRDTPRRPNPGDETNESPGIPKASQDNRTGDAAQDKRGQQPGEAEPENKQPAPAREPLRRPGAARGVEPKDLQSLLDYRDERARAESRLDRAKQLEYDDRRRTKSPEPDSPSPATPPGRSSPRDDSLGDGRPRQTGDPTTGDNRAHEPLRRPGAARAVDPKDLQSLLDYRDERARILGPIERAKRLEYDDRRRTSLPEPDDPQPTASGISEQVRTRDATSEDQVVAGGATAASPDTRKEVQPPRGHQGGIESDDGRQSQQSGEPPAWRASEGGQLPEGNLDERRTDQKGDGSSASQLDDARPTPPGSGVPRTAGPSGALEHAASLTHDSGSPTEHAGPKPADGEARPERDESGRGIDVGDIRDPELAALIDAAERATSPDRLSNRDRPPQHGDVQYHVDIPPDWATTITDLDLVYGDTLWEIKEADGRDPHMDTDRWIAKQLTGKLDRYAETREHLPGYEEARIGYFINTADSLPDFKDRVQAAIDGWQQSHPDIAVRLRWRE